MGTTLIIFYAISIGLLAGSISSVLSSQPTSAQMMNPNMMFNGTGVNPNMMFNGSGINPMFMQDQNITGSIKLAPTLINSIASQIKVSLSDAAAIVQNQAGNKSNVVAAHLDVANGYLTYTVIAVDHDANIHKFVIDAGNGKVLSSSKLSLQNMMMFGGMMGHNMMGSMMGHNMMGSMMGHNMMGSMMGHNMMGSMMGHNMMNPNMTGNMMNPNMTGNMMNPNMTGNMMNPNMTGNMMGFQ